MATRVEAAQPDSDERYCLAAERIAARGLATRRRKLDSPTNVSIEIARIAFDLFKRNYSWPKPLRGIGVRGADLCPADCAVQLGFFSNEEKREKLEHIDKAVDTLRQRYGYRGVQRAVVYTDPVLGGINAYDDHNIHPVGYFHTA